MNEWYPINTQYVQANSKDTIRNIKQYLKNPIGATVTLLTPPTAFVTDAIDDDRTRIVNGNDLQWKLGNTTAETRLILQADWTVNKKTETAHAIIEFKVLADTDLLEWYWFPPIDVFVGNSGNFSGTIASGIDDNLNNPSGATVTYSIPSKSPGILSASLNSDNELSISVTELTESKFDAFVTVQAVATIDGVPRTVEGQIDIRLVHAISEKGDKGEKGDTGVGEKGDAGDDSTVPGPKGDTGVGEKGDTGAASTERGPKGDTGVGEKGDTGAASTERGPKGDTGVGKKGDTGAASTERGPKGDTGTGEKGDTGAASTERGPKGDTGVGEKGDTGADSTAPGPKGDTGVGKKGDTGAASTERGPKGDTGVGEKGDTGADSTAPGPKGDTGVGDTGPPPDDSQISSAVSTYISENSIQGDTGVKGDTGVGEKGDTGAASAGTYSGSDGISVSSDPNVTDGYIISGSTLSNSISSLDSGLAALVDRVSALESS